MTHTALPTTTRPRLSDSAPADDAGIPLRPHQLGALAAATDALAWHDRGQLHMACGTGKTLTALRLAERLRADLVLVLVPSLSLLAQTMREWRQHAQSPFSSIAVCSDDTVANPEAASLTDIPVPVTTNQDVLAAELAVRPPGRTVVFATYHSAAVVAAAQTLGAPAFDLALADEAHRTAGHAAKSFRLILDANRIRATKRVFMTATPRLSNGQSAASMDDEALYGPVMFRFGFAEAIEARLLCDYQVVVVGITDDDVRDQLEQGAKVVVGGRALNGQEGAAAVAVLKAMEDYGVTRMITFHGSVERAERFATALPDVASVMLSPDRAAGLSTGHVNGGMTAGERAEQLDTLRTLAPGQRRVLTNARCLTEGVDVPAIDGVAFIDPRSSYSDIVQAVGRALRTAPGKAVGTILLPVYLSVDEDPEDALASSAFADVCTVVAALRDHDPALGAALDAARAELATESATPRLPGNLAVELPTQLGQDFHAALYTRLVTRTTKSFWETLQRLTDHLAVHGAYPTVSSAPDLKAFADRQRLRRRRGYMSRKEEAALEALPDWFWNRGTVDEDVRSEVRAMREAGCSYTAIAATLNAARIPRATGAFTWTSDAVRRLILGHKECMVIAIGKDERWERRYTQLKAWTDTVGPLRRRNAGIGAPLSRWMSQQKGLYRADDPRMTPDLIARLEVLPGWFWEQAKPGSRFRQAA